MGYRSERLAHFDRPFEKLYRLQRRLGAPQGWGVVPPRPKGMWRRTYERHLERYEALDDECGREVLALMRGLGVPLPVIAGET